MLKESAHMNAHEAHHWSIESRPTAEPAAGGMLANPGARVLPLGMVLNSTTPAPSLPLRIYLAPECWTMHVGNSLWSKVSASAAVSVS